jgi:hypothetical protein
MRGLWTEFTAFALGGNDIAPVVVDDEDEVPQGTTERRVSE